MQHGLIAGAALALGEYGMNAAAKQERRSEIGEQLDYLEKTIAGLGELVERVNTRLQPILASVPPASTAAMGAGVAPACDSALAQQLQALDGRLSSIALMLAGTNDRLRI